MAVNTGNNEKVNNSQMGSQLDAARQQNQQNQNQGNTTARNKGMMNFASKLKAPMGRFSTSENVVAVRDAIQEAMQKHFDDQSVLNAYKIFAADKDKVNIGNVSCVIVCNEEHFNGNVYVAFNILIIEKTAPTLSAQPINIDGHNYEEIITTGDLYDDNMAKRAERLVIEAYGNRPELKVLEAGHEVIPSETDISDEETIHQITFNSVMACFSVLQETKNERDKLFSISEIDRANEMLTVNLDYNPAKVESFTGDPIRSDISINLQSKLKTQANEMFERVTPIGRLDGYVDLIYSPPAPAQPGYPQDTRHFYPRFVITRMDSELNINTIPLQLLNLVQSNILAYNSAWMGAFKPRHHIKGIDPRDVGAIGYEVPMTNDPNVFEKVDTKSQEFNEVSFFQFMKTYFHDSPIISLDVEESGELSWLNDVFVEAGLGTPQAKAAIMDAANTLTSGEFGSMWDANADICTLDNRVHMGYYVDENGDRRDIRELDYLAVMNIAGKDDKTLVERWEASFSQTNIAQPIRMEDRAKIISAFLSGAKVKAYAQRVNFSPNFLSVLLEACRKAGLVVQPQNVYQTNSAGMNRGYTNAGAMALQAPGNATGVFSYGGNQTGNWTAHQPYTGRFRY